MSVLSGLPRAQRTIEHSQRELRVVSSAEKRKALNPLRMTTMQRVTKIKRTKLERNERRGKEKGVDEPERSASKRKWRE